MDVPHSDTSARFLIGIDLGTTNSALAFVDLADKRPVVRDFPIPQLAAPGQVEARDVLPSFHYEPASGEFPAEAIAMPWESRGEADTETNRWIVGTFARDHGGAVAGRLVSSAKSWLSHSGVDRTAALLPWHGAADVQKLSPVEVSSRYLAHMRSAWDASHPEHPLAQQEIVLGIPASFDEVARELTIQAAQRAGLPRVFLVEEPQAAFYAWIDSQKGDWDSRVRPGQTILVCDIGGGTSDFTLIQVRAGRDGSVNFHRVAVGEHLILGGDNLDLALAHHVEKKIAAALSPAQWGTLLRLCRQVKETLLGKNPPERFTLSVAAPGAKLIGGAIQLELNRDEVEQLLVDGFLPRVALSEKPAPRRSGFQEFGLPYAPDPAMTKYLAAFLSAHRNQQTGEPAARPDMVLFNGGLFESSLLRQRMLDVLCRWFNDTQPDWEPRVLRNDRMDLAVARGAAYFALARRGLGVRISGGLAHSYYLGVEAAEGPVAICLAPAGIEQGETIELTERRFSLRLRQPAEFPLFYSSTRTTDKPGDLVPIDPEELSSLPPIRTVLQSSKSSVAQEIVSVKLHARLTEVGTLDIWCAAIDSDRRWKLQFDVRSATRSDAAPHRGTGESLGVVDESVLEACKSQIRDAFGQGGKTSPASIIKLLQTTTGMPRHDWPPSLLREFWDALLPLQESRGKSVEHESRWLNLLGFSLRPGFGLAVDDWRVSQTWKLFGRGVQQAKNELCRAEWWILWRRIAGGLAPAQQMLIGEPLIADWRNYVRKGGIGVRGRSPAFQFGAHESTEVWRLLGSLELLRPSLKSEMGNMILDRLQSRGSAVATAERDAMLFALGRLGARQLVYGPLNLVLSSEEVTNWINRLMQIESANVRAVFALVQLSRKTSDRHRDLQEAVRTSVLDWLAAHDAPGHLIRLVSDGGALDEAEQRTVFGESLPRGLRIE